MRAVIIFVLLGLAACSGHDLATPSGKVFAFNPGQWNPSPADMTVPRRARQ